MGHIISQLFKSDIKVSTVKNGVDAKTQTQSEENEFSQVMKTPIMFRKSNACNEDYERNLARTNFLQNSKLDPRSPTVGIYRTPILLDGKDSETAEFSNFDSPISIYSSNLGNSIIEDLKTPTEPSVNVSCFSEGNRVENDFVLPWESPESNRVPNKINVSDKPRTIEAKKLFNEINLVNRSLCVEGKTFKGEQKDCAKTFSSKSFNNSKRNSLKGRTPLSNITLSNNSPSVLKKSEKAFARKKASAEFGSENSVTPIAQQLASWDKNNTVII